MSTAKGLDPPSSFAYRKEFAGHLVALFCRWAIPEWLAQCGRLWVVDWDESNAFSNVHRGGLQEMCPDDIALDPLYQSFYDRLAVYVQTPFGLVGPYRMLHGGAQGDSMGVGGFKELGPIRSRANAAMVPRALRPESGLPGGPDPVEWCPAHPAEPSEYVPEVSFSDDRRIFAYSDEGICHALRVSQKTCLAGGGDVNRAKLQAFCPTLREGAIQYNKGTIETAMGALQVCTSDLAMVKVPIVMGESPRAVPGKYRDALRHLGWALPRTAPSYALATRVVAGFALAKADFVFDAVPVLGTDLTDIQKLSDVIHRRALRLPRSFPRAVLYRPLERLGLALPRLSQRHAVRYVHAIVSALNCRSSYVSLLLRHVLQGASWKSQAFSDAHALYHWLDSWGLALCFLPGPAALEASIQLTVHRPYGGSVLVVASDGACGPAAVAYAAVLADDAGIVAEAHAAVQVHDPDSFAAEWLSRFLGLYLVEQVQPTPTVRVLALADNTHVTTEAEDHQPSGSTLLDRLRVAYARGLHAYDAEELYVPSQSSEVLQPAGNPQTLADLQRAAHIRATGRLHRAERGTVPFAAAVGDGVLLTSKGVTLWHSSGSTSAWPPRCRIWTPWSRVVRLRQPCGGVLSWRLS